MIDGWGELVSVKNQPQRQQYNGGVVVAGTRALEWNAPSSTNPAVVPGRSGVKLEPECALFGVIGGLASSVVLEPDLFPVGAIAQSCQLLGSAANGN